MRYQLSITKDPLKTLILNISKSAVSNPLNFLVHNTWSWYCILLIKFLWWGHNGFKRYNWICCSILWNLVALIAIWKCTPLITTPDKDILIFITHWRCLSTARPVLVTTSVERPSLYLVRFILWVIPYNYQTSCQINYLACG